MHGMKKNPKKKGIKRVWSVKNSEHKKKEKVWRKTSKKLFWKNGIKDGLGVDESFFSVFSSSFYSACIW